MPINPVAETKQLSPDAMQTIWNVVKMQPQKLLVCISPVHNHFRDF